MCLPLTRRQTRVISEGEQATIHCSHSEIIRDAAAQPAELLQAGEVPCGELLKINGPASMPVAMLGAQARKVVRE